MCIRDSLWNPRAQDLKYAGVQAEDWRILADPELQDTHWG